MEEVRIRKWNDKVNIYLRSHKLISTEPPFKAHITVPTHQTLSPSRKPYVNSEEQLERFRGILHGRWSWARESEWHSETTTFWVRARNWRGWAAAGFCWNPTYTTPFPTLPPIFSTLSNSSNPVLMASSSPYGLPHLFFVWSPFCNPELSCFSLLFFFSFLIY